MPSRISPSGFKELSDSALFKPLKLGAIQIEHRVMMAPLTRMRAPKESEGVWVPGDLNVEYYSQRASKGGLQLTEACPISRLACGYPGVPGIFTPSQIAGWKRVTDGVHSKGGFIYCQLWHVGRATVPGLLGGEDCVSSSDVPLKGNALDGSLYAATPPRALTVEEIGEVVEEFAAAAKRAMEAGFDGVEIHGANGYLLDQFLHDNVNIRTDLYGGSIENRCRFPLEVLKAITNVVGPDRVGMRLSPYNYFQDTRDSNPNVHWAYLCEQLASSPEENRLSYVHMVEPRFDEVLDEQAKIDSLAVETKSDTKAQSLVPFQRILKKGGIKFIAAGGFKRDNAAPKVEAGDADGIMFGRWFIANPDLPIRLADGLPLNDYDRNTFYGADPPSKGYVDYPYFAAKTPA
ncbi:FMN-linked oxidoreductase [Glarea lozoyensis ATCC 20868]|uniref:FMN-linked oxidoreductase n=1 Tax=Glarea lozoyensis (strain ATCC 20868 / MF5171) TaxID=1116229 RepID=S3DXQ6_GLAL2|nr:FMN-linked oxidoreductase [Glarea lozoyensis ATCC 20868]EPE36706.1 FMN-linked oxidoreductase [Glarea lozoyensis ATCC 20868]